MPLAPKVKPAKPTVKVNYKLLYDNNRKQMRLRLDRIGAICTNGPNTLSPEMSERLIGAEHALREMLHEQNYLTRWLDIEAKKIIEFHASIRQDCECGVCRKKG